MKGRAFIAEFLGTIILVYAQIRFSLTARSPAESATLIAASHAAVASATLASGSGRHNPAISLAMWTMRRLGPRALTLDLVAQALGAVVAGIAARFVSPTPTTSAFVALSPQTHPLDFSTIAATVMATLILVVVYIGTVVDPKGPKAGAAFVGLAIFVACYLQPSSLGWSVSIPASIGALVALGRFDSLLTQTLGTAIAAIVGGAAYAFFMAETPATSRD